MRIQQKGRDICKLKILKHESNQIEELSQGAIHWYLVRNGAGNGARTRDFQLGKLTLYRLSYARFQ